jgi:hypothetical protein
MLASATAFFAGITVGPTIVAGTPGPRVVRLSRSSICSPETSAPAGTGTTK